MIEKMVGTKSIEEALNIAPFVSDKMQNAIELWDLMYRGEAPWLKEATLSDPEKIISLGLPAVIASEKARQATIEMKSVITDVGKKATSTDTNVREDFIPTTRAQYLNKQYQLHCLPHIRRQLEYGIAKGSLIIKPFIFNDTDIYFTFHQADEFFPLSFSPTGKMTEACFTETITIRDNKYTRLEYHKLDPKNNRVTIINKAYKSVLGEQHSPSDGILGTEVPLNSVSGWETIDEVTEIKDVDRLLFAYFKMPEANTIDPVSPLGVSGFSRAVNLIKEADLQFSRLSWEYEGGQLAVDVDPHALKTEVIRSGGKEKKIEVQNVLNKRLFRKLDLGGDDTYKAYNPSLRDANFINGLDSILMRIEDAVGLSRGTFSNITRSEAKTATEMTIMRQRSFATNGDIQIALQSALSDLIYVMDVFTTLYELAPDGEYDVSFEWDDSLITDPEAEYQRRLNLVSAGMESELNFRMWYFGETEAQASAQLALIQQERLAKVQDQLMLGQAVQEPTEEPIDEPTAVEEAVMEEGV